MTSLDNYTPNALPAAELRLQDRWYPRTPGGAVLPGQGRDPPDDQKALVAEDTQTAPEDTHCPKRRKRGASPSRKKPQCPSLKPISRAAGSVRERQLEETRPEKAAQSPPPRYEDFLARADNVEQRSRGPRRSMSKTSVAYTKNRNRPAPGTETRATATMLLSTHMA